jgi:uncharacterized protein YrrD
MKLFTSSALVTLLAASTAMAQSQNSSASNSDTAAGTDTSSGAEEMYNGDDASTSDGQNLVRTRDITGSPVYSIAPTDVSDWDVTIAAQEVDSNWTEIGAIEDLVLSRSGKLSGVVAEVGGFLDIGDKHVLLPINDVKLVPSEDMTYSIVTRFTEDDLEDLENIDESPWY